MIKNIQNDLVNKIAFLVKEKEGETACIHYSTNLAFSNTNNIIGCMANIKRYQ